MTVQADLLGDAVGHLHTIIEAYTVIRIAYDVETRATPSQSFQEFPPPDMPESILRNPALPAIHPYEGRAFPVEPYDGETLATRFQSTENHLLHITMQFESDAADQVVAVLIPLIPGIPPQRFVRS